MKGKRWVDGIVEDMYGVVCVVDEILMERVF